jgi:hypothetical protein
MWFDMRSIESLENFMSLKRGINSEDVAKLEAMLYPGGVNRTVSEADIEHIERTLDCKLPKDYKTFLREYGYACWFGRRIYGIPPVEGADIESYNDSVIDNTLYLRGFDNADLQASLGKSAVIGRDEMGGYFVMDSANVDGQSQIRWIDHETDFSTVEAWPSFTAYVEHYYLVDSDADAQEIG